MLRNLFVATAVASFAVSSFVAVAQKPATPKLTEELPPGPMQAKATTSCLECHEASIIVQQRLSKGAWTKEVDKMIKWGALVAPEDHDAFVDYLSTNFGTDKPAYTAYRLQNSTAKLSKK